MSQKPLADRGISEAECLECEIQGITGYLPKVGMSALQSPQPRILNLLVAPQTRDPFSPHQESVPRTG